MAQSLTPLRPPVHLTPSAHLGPVSFRYDTDGGRRKARELVLTGVERLPDGTVVPLLLADASGVDWPLCCASQVDAFADAIGDVIGEYTDAIVATFGLQIEFVGVTPAVASVTFYDNQNNRMGIGIVLDPLTGLPHDESIARVVAAIRGTFLSSVVGV